MAAVVEAEELGRRYGRRWALARVDLQLGAGDRLLVVGSNGSGKTTLLRTLSTLVSPSVGTLRLFGRDPADDVDAVRRRLALVSHRLGVYEDLSARDNLTFFGKVTRRAVPPGLLDEVGLDDRPEPVGTYSAGMKKRLALAILLLQQPELVLLDEPYGQLDPAGMDRITALVQKLEGTVVMASHQLERATQLGGRALLLDQGLPRWSGPVGDVVRAWQAVHPGAVPELA